MSDLSSKRRSLGYWWLVDVGLIAALTVIFGIWFVWHHAVGAWGDDAPGYIYTASQLARGEPLVRQDALVQQALKFFGEERLARFVAPAHHEIISPQGWIASRYPIGLSVLMVLTAAAAGNELAMYNVVPVAAVAVVVLTYLLGVWLLPLTAALKRVAGLVSAVGVGLADVFANYAVAEPMREIPSLAFWLISVLAGWQGRRLVSEHGESGSGRSRRWLGYGLLAVAGLAFGYSVNIRETSAVLVVPLIILLWPERTKEKASSRRQKWHWFGVVAVGLLVALSVTIWNSVTITLHKEKFREKDISRIAITSNLDHIQSLQFSNLINNQGKFKPGVGGLRQYWQVMKGFNLWQPWLLLAVVGLVALWRTNRRLAISFGLWFGLIYLLFAMWINPYPRYILPLLPAVAVMAAYGLLTAPTYLQRWLHLSGRWQQFFTILAVVSFFLMQRSAVAQLNDRVRSAEPVYKSLTVDDFATLKNLSNFITEQAAANYTATEDVTKPSKPAAKSIGQRPPLLLMLGSYKGGIAEMIMAHSDLRVIRFPGKPNEQPELNQFLAFISELQKNYQLFLWYDATASADEQRFLHQLALSDPLLVMQYSFQPNVTIYAITANNQ